MLSSKHNSIPIPKSDLSQTPSSFGTTNHDAEKTEFLKKISYNLPL